MRFYGTALIPWTFKFKKTKFLRIKCLLPRPNLYPRHFQFRPIEWHMLTHHFLLFLQSHSREDPWLAKCHFGYSWVSLRLGTMVNEWSSGR